MPKPSDSVVFVGRATPAVMAATAKRTIRVKETIFCDSDVVVDWTSNALLASIYGAKTSDALSLSSLVQPFIFPAIESWHSPATVRQGTYGVICPELMILNQLRVKNPMRGRLWEELSGKMSVIDIAVTDLHSKCDTLLEVSTLPLWSTYSVILTWECVKGFHMVRTITNPVRNTWLVQDIAKENVSFKIVFRSWKSRY